MNELQPSRSAAKPPFEGVRPQTDAEFARADRMIDHMSIVLQEVVRLPEKPGTEKTPRAPIYEAAVDEAVAKAIKDPAALPEAPHAPIGPSKLSKAFETVRTQLEDPLEGARRKSRQRPPRYDARGELAAWHMERKRPNPLMVFGRNVARMYRLRRVENFFDKRAGGDHRKAYPLKEAMEYRLADYRARREAAGKMPQTGQGKLSRFREVQQQNEPENRFE